MIQNEVEFKEYVGVILDEDMNTFVKGFYGIGDICNTVYKKTVVNYVDVWISVMLIDKYKKVQKSVKADWIHNYIWRYNFQTM